MLLEKCGKENLNPRKTFQLLSLLPCKNTLLCHIQRVNYLVLIWKIFHEHFPCIPVPCKDNGWDILNNNIQPYWYEGLPIPYELTDAEIHDHDLSEDGSDMEENEQVAEPDSDEEFYLTNYDE